MEEKIYSAVKGFVLRNKKSLTIAAIAFMLMAKKENQIEALTKSLEAVKNSSMTIVISNK